MKKTLFALLAGAAILAACTPAANKTATINAALTGLENDSIRITYWSLTDTRRMNMECDTIVAQDGAFTFQAEADSVPKEVYLFPLGGRQYLSLYLFPGETVQLTGSMMDYQLAGSPLNEACLEVSKLWKPYREKLDSLNGVMTRMQNDNTPEEEVKKVFIECYQPVRKEMREAQVQYVRQHSDSDVSLHLLAGLSRGDVMELLPTLADNVKNGPLACLYQNMEKMVQEAKAREEAQKKIVEGADAPDFTLKDINGNDLALSSLRGKYVVLDFWGSWCGWCIKGMPEMKKYYEKYKERMEILGIDCRDTEDSWKAAVEQHQLPWLHVHNEGEPDVSIMYGISGYPTKIVIDPEGKIAKKVVGESPEFYKYLDELFK